MSTIRLDKYLADAGIGTRTQVKTYIRKGNVSINDTLITKPETKINPDNDIVMFLGKCIYVSEFEYYLLNKPAGYVSATKDNTSPTVLSLINSVRHDLFPVGRLDKDTEGLLIITNDGNLSHRLLSPKHHVDKTYYAVIDGVVVQDDIDAFANGLNIGDDDLKTTLPAKLELLSEPGIHYPTRIFSYYNEQSTNVFDTMYSNNHSYVYVTITEGKYHQVKRMFQHIGKKVIYLKRISFGSLSLPANLDIGQSRQLTDDELELLRKSY